MRVLVVSNLFPPVAVGGYERECAVVVERLRRGHDVLVLCSDLRAGEAPGSEKQVRRELPFLHHTRRDSLRAPLASLGAARTMRRVLDEHDPELIWIWNGSGIPQAALRVAQCSGRPVAWRICQAWFGDLYRVDQFTRHLTPGERGLRGAWARAVRVLNRHPALRLDVSRAVPGAISWNSDTLRETTPVPAAVQPVLQRRSYPATADTARFATLPRTPLPRPAIAFVGRLTEAKGADLAVRALALLRDRHEIRADLVMAGPVEPPMAETLSALARELDLDGSVQLLGELDGAGVAGLLQGAHVALVPSREPEGFGLVCAEAAYARVPVVAARNGAMPEVLREGAEALFFTIDDAQGCAEALAATLGDRPATAVRVARAFERAQDFSLERYLEESERFVLDAVAALGGATRR